jgi:hypothetical protein
MITSGANQCVVVLFGIVLWGYVAILSLPIMLRANGPIFVAKTDGHIIYHGRVDHEVRG